MYHFLNFGLFSFSEMSPIQFRVLVAYNLLILPLLFAWCGNILMKKQIQKALNTNSLQA